MGPDLQGHTETYRLNRGGLQRGLFLVIIHEHMKNEVAEGLKVVVGGVTG